MNAAATATRPARLEAVPYHPRGALIFSVAFHIIIILLLIFGLPFIHHTTPPESTPLSVELVNPNQVTQATHPPMRAPKQPPVAKTPVQKPPPTPPPVAAAPPPTPTPPVKPDEVKTPDTPKPPDELAPPKKAEKPKPVKTPPKPKQEKPTKEVAKEQQQDFNSLLKNLVPAQATAAAAPDAPDTPDKKTPDAPASQPMGTNDLAALSRQLGECWKLMGGAPDAQNLSVDLRLKINSDRTLSEATVVDQERYNNDPYYRATAESALRAVHDPHCNPLELPPDKYDEWKEITVTFDPSEMLQ